MVEILAVNFIFSVLAHQRRRLRGSLYDRHLSIVVVCRMTSTLPNDISSEATRGIKPKCNLWHAWAGGLKVCVFYENFRLNLVAMKT